MSRIMSAGGKCVVCGKGVMLRSYPAGIGENPSEVMALAHPICWKAMQAGKKKTVSMVEIRFGHKQ